MSEPIVRAAVIDDEPSAREAVLTLLAGDPRVQVVAQAGNGREAVDVLRRVRPALVFLDVLMPDLDGFDVLEELGQDMPPAVIFVTAHDEHALRAFDVHALDYVLKPFGRPRFGVAVNRALERLAAQQALSLQHAVSAHRSARAPDAAAAGTLAVAHVVRNETASHENHVGAPLRRIPVRNGARTTLIDVDSLSWVEACGDYVRLHTDGAAHLLADTMHVMERRLDPRRFLRVHRSIIVNLDRVTELQRQADGSGTLLLRSGVRLRVARGRWDQLSQALGIRSAQALLP